MVVATAEIRRSDIDCMSAWIAASLVAELELILADDVGCQ